MKKTFSILLVLTVVFSLCACKKVPESGVWQDGPSSAESTSAEEETLTRRVLEALTLRKISPEKIIVVYLDLRDGVKETANAFCGELGCGSFEITPIEPYPEDEAAKLARADREFANNEYPALGTYLDNAADYLAMIAVYPELNGNVPMALKTFFDDYDLRRTAVLPVCVCSDEDAGESFDQIKNNMLFSPVYSGVEVHNGDNVDALCAEWADAALK